MDPVELRLLDPPVEFLVGDTSVSIDRPVEARLVTALGVRSGRPVSNDTLIEAVWGDDLPANPDGALHTTVSRIRRALGSDGRKIVEKAPNGYRLAHTRVDVESFRSTVTDDRPVSDDARFDALRAEIDRFPDDGRPLTAVRDTDWLEAEARVLEQLHIRALEEMIRIGLRLGMSSDLLPRLTTLTERHPEVESFWVG